MKRIWISATLVLALGVFAAAQTTPAEQQNSSNPPQGTTVTHTSTDTIVQPTEKAVKITPGVIESAQKALADRGYDPGPADGVAGPRTEAALQKFQADQGLAATGRLDINTMEKLNVGGANSVATAPADIGRGGKAFGHNIKQGHPVAAGKAMGSGAESAGKSVGKGAKSLAVGAADKVGKGLSAIGHKISNKTEGKEKPKPQPETPHF